MLFSNALNTFL